jgi:hypothetical protein
VSHPQLGFHHVSHGLTGCGWLAAC